MAKRLTPIERAIAGKLPDRRRRYEDKMKAEGFVRVGSYVRAEDVEIFSQLAAALRENPEEAGAELRRIAEALGDGPERPQRQRSEDAPPRPAASPERHS